MEDNQNFLRIAIAMAGTCFMLGACTTLAELGNELDPPPASVRQSNGAAVEDSNGVITYADYQTVRARNGDTVQIVADRIGISGDELAVYNGLTAIDQLSDGQILVIPPGTTIVTSDTGLATIATEALDSAPSSPSAPITGSDNTIRHTVQSGETAYVIARRYGVSVTALSSWNGLDADLSLRIGQRLLIPTGGVDRSQAAVAPEPEPTRKPATSLPKPVPRPAVTSAPAPAPEPETTEVVAIPEPSAPARFIAPVDGPVLRPFSKKSGGNEGIDYQVSVGTSVRAANDGTVALISKSVGDTSIVLLRHTNNLYSVYSNLNGVSLSKGDQVSRGQSIGKVAGGNPPYVHFEIRNGTEAVDPAPYL